MEVVECFDPTCFGGSYDVVQGSACQARLKTKSVTERKTFSKDNQ